MNSVEDTCDRDLLQIHALVVIAVDHAQVTVLDPLVGERQLPREDFEAIWAATRWLTLMVAA